MILTLIGLILSFTGPIKLIVDTLLNFKREKTHFSLTYSYGTDKKPEVLRMVRNPKTGRYDEPKISREEIDLIISFRYWISPSNNRHSFNKKSVIRFYTQIILFTQSLLDKKI